jgi:uncharacterized protein YbjT (DUF2867 family)
MKILAIAGAVALLATGTMAAPASAATGTAGRGLVVVAGANGRTGRFVVEQLVAAKWHVRVLVRDAAKAGDAAKQGLDVKVADVRDPASLGPALKGAAYVISAIGASGGMKTAPGDGPQEVDNAGVANLARAAHAAGVRQLVLVSSAYTSKAETYPAEFLRPSLRAKFAGEQAVRASGVPYTIVKPGGLTDDAATGSVALSQGDVATGVIPRADVAAVCVAALGRKAAVGKTFEVVSGKAEVPGNWDARFAALKADAPATAAP